MADHPIPFSGAMVRANNDGRKTQTRRLLMPDNLRIWTGGLDHDGKFVKLDTGMFEAAMNNARNFRFIGHSLSWVTDPAPHQRTAVMAQWQGKLSIAVGDRLWVREKWRTESRAYDDLSPSQLGGEETILYDADGRWRDNKSAGRVRASMHMPRWASRTTLIVDAIKIERLQDISEADAKAEGAMLHVPCKSAVAGTTVAPDSYYFDITLDGRLYEGPTARDAYEILWGKINGWDSWDANPWVVATTYRVIRQNIDDLPAHEVMVS